MEQFQAIIIGAGPAGMMAAIRAAERGRKVLLIEQNNTTGKKLLISGKGRCNLTNSCDIQDFLEKFSPSRNFLKNSFAKFFNVELMSFFQQAHLKLKTERGGRIFPKSDRSSDVLNVLKSKLNNKYITLLLGERVREIILKDKQIEGIITHSGKQFLAPHIAIATGGKSYPGTGSTGDGYKIAKNLGHEIIPLKPALSPIIVKEKFVTDWQGIALKNVRVTLFSQGKKIDQRFGEMLFTHFGLSGPIILDLSASIYNALKLNNNVEISINFKPALDHKILNARLLREFETNSRKNLKKMFKNLMPQGIIVRFLQYCGVDENKSVNQITTEERKKLIRGLFDLRLTVESVIPIKDSIVTRGGVNTKQINPKTMESKLINGLFFAGEVIDIDAKTGGYNMQAAFSTGWVCGDSL
ncbi:MAG: NAD(P)/FAD-dependent oxidoreductase [Candidatus Omnitrophota bacterium]